MPNTFSKRHDKETFNLRKQKDQRSLNGTKQSKIIIFIILFDEKQVLSYGLDQHITNYSDRSTNTKFQKQPSEVYCKKSCSEKFPKMHRKIPVPGSLF